MAGHLDMEFNFRNESTGTRVESRPFNLLALGNFRGIREGKDLRDAKDCRVIGVDLDNIDDLWTMLEPRVEFDLGQALVSLAPRDLDHFHPDHLYRTLPVFQEMRKMRRKLLDPATSKSALDEILSARNAPGSEPEKPGTAEAQAPTDESADALFERLLGKSSGTPAERPPAEPESERLEALVQRLVAPHIVHEPDPRADSVVDSLDLAAAELMRNILHHPDFQALEASWRSLCDTVSQLELDENLQFFVCDVCREELLNALPAPGVSLADSPLFELLVGRRRQAEDDSPWTVIAADHYFGSGPEDIALLTALGAAAAVNGGVFLGGAQPAVLGAASTTDLADAHAWSGSDEGQRLWQSLRQSPVAPHIGLALPRVLGRTPYGKDDEEIDSFPFEEIRSRTHEDYLWGNPAWHCGRLLAEQFSREGWRMDPGSHLDLGYLPSHSYEEDGEKKLQPCAELLIPESTMTAIFEHGLMPVVSYRNRNTAVLGRFQSIAEPLAALAGAWKR